MIYLYLKTFLIDLIAIHLDYSIEKYLEEKNKHMINSIA